MTKTITNGLAAAIVATVCFCGSTEAAVVASPRIVDISPDAPAASAVTLTNIFKNLQNNTTYRLLPGTNPVSSFPYTDPPLAAPPHLMVRDKTNITFEGFGWNSVVSTPHTGTVFSVFNCQNITFRNFAIRGTRVPNGGTQGDLLLSAVILQGTNGGLVFDGMLIENHTIHGIAGQFSNSTNTLITRTTFRQVGTTNVNAGANSDGACIMCPGSNLRVENCRFEQSFNGVECWGAVGSASATSSGIRNWVVQGNQFVGMWGYSYYHQNASDIINNSEGFVFANNVIDYDPATYWGIYASPCIIRFGKRGIIANNTVRRAHYGFQINNQGGGCIVEDWTIVNNQVHGIGGLAAGGYGMAFYLDGNLGTLRNVQLVNNTAEFCAEAFLHGVTVSHARIAGNIIQAMNTNVASRGAIWLRADCRSNVLENNIFKYYGDTVANRSAYGIHLNASGDNFNIVQNNDFKEFTSAAWLDSGVGNEFRHNWSGTNFMVRSTVNQHATSVTLTADNQSVSSATIHIRLQSDNATAANRTFVLTQGAYVDQELTIEWVGTNAGEIVDDSAQTGAGNHRLSATWTPTQYDILFLRFNGTDWVEQSRSPN